MDLELRGKRAVVTGASRGIGLAIARALYAEGADVALVARDKAALDEAAAGLTGTAPAGAPAPRVLAVSADTGDDDSVAALAAQVLAAFGGVDVLVNAAAQPSTGAFPESALEGEINVKVRGYLRTARAFAPQMAERGWGRIVNISGAAARQSGSLVGSVRNVAVAALTKNLADELGPQGVNVHVVHPGYTRTEATPARLAAAAEARGTTPAEAEAAVAAGISIGRIVTAEEIADVVAFLASPKSVSLNGDPILTTGGIRGPIFY